MRQTAHLHLVQRLRTEVCVYSRHTPSWRVLGQLYLQLKAHTKCLAETEYSLFHIYDTAELRVEFLASRFAVLRNLLVK